MCCSVISVDLNQSQIHKHAVYWYQVGKLRVTIRRRWRALGPNLAYCTAPTRFLGESAPADLHCPFLAHSTMTPEAWGPDVR